MTGRGRSFCAALLFLGKDALAGLARAEGVRADTPAEIARDGRIVSLIGEVVAAVNAHLPRWSAIRAFLVVPVSPTVENGLASPTMKLRRSHVRELFAGEIEAMYGGAAAPEPQA